MVRGCQRKIYVVKSTESPLFEEAYFILKRNPAHQTAISESEMAREANRIVQDICGVSNLYRKNNGLGTKVWAFVLGAAASSAVMGSLALVALLV